MQDSLLALLQCCSTLMTGCPFEYIMAVIEQSQGIVNTRLYRLTFPFIFHYSYFWFMTTMDNIKPKNILISVVYVSQLKIYNKLIILL
jgi:hypothetical protein